MTTLNLSFLGTFQAFLNGHTITTFRSAKVQGLLIFLAIESTQPHSRDLLASMFWPDQPDKVARKNLRQSLYQLRQVLEDDTAEDDEATFLHITRSQVQFNVKSNYTLDTQTFLDAIKTQQWEEVGRVYQGDLLTGFTCDSLPFEEWLRETRERLHSLALDAFYQMAQSGLDLANYTQAEIYAKRQLRLEPWREEAHQQLLLALALMGERSAALAQFEICTAVLEEELGVPPSERTVALYESIKAGEIRSERPLRSVSQSPILHNLPSQQTPFIGRERELTKLDQLLQDSQTRLITIIGPGGFGKTRFSIAYAERLIAPANNHSSPFTDGVYFISLVNVSTTSNLSTSDSISLAILRALNLPLEVNEGQTVRSPKQQLLNYLRNKRLLLILDNFEHLLGGNMLIADIIQAAAKVKLLITSRERLNLYEEQLFALRGLALPTAEMMHPTAASETAAEAEAIQLFLRSARRIRHDFEVRPDEWPYLCQLCYSLGGIPLAIELAASWVEMLSITAILHELDRSPDLLSTGLQNVATRHRSMWQILEYSWQQLNEEEQSCLAALSVFRGNFTRPAAQQITAATLSTTLTIQVLSNLVHKSMLYYDHQQDVYTIHELLRQYAADRLARDIEQEAAVRRQHSYHFCHWLAQFEDDFKGATQREALTTVEADIENIRVAWQWAVAQRNLELLNAAVSPLFLFYDTRSWFQEGERLFREAAVRLDNETATDEQKLLTAKLQARQGWFTFHLGNQHESITLLQNSLQTLQALDATAATIFNYNYLGAVLRHEDNFAETTELLTTALQLAQQYENHYQASISLNILGQTAWLQGDAPLARHYCQEALRLKRKIGDTRGMTYSLTYLGRLAEADRQFVEAEQLYQESLSISESLGDQRGVALVLQDLGRIAFEQNKFEQADALYNRSLRIFDRIGNRAAASACLIQLGRIHSAQDHLEQAHLFLRDGLDMALETKYEHGLIDGVLEFSQLQLKAGAHTIGLTGLHFIEQYPHGTTSQRQHAQQLLQTFPTAELTLPTHIIATDHNLTEFVKAWLNLT